MLQEIQNPFLSIMEKAELLSDHRFFFWGFSIPFQLLRFPIRKQLISRQSVLSCWPLRGQRNSHWISVEILHSQQVSIINERSQEELHRWRHWNHCLGWWVLWETIWVCINKSDGNSLIIVLLHFSIFITNNNKMSNILCETLTISLSFVECLSNSSGIIFKESSMDHKLDLSFFQNWTTLTSICKDSHCLSRGFFCDFNVRIDGIVISCNWLGYFQIPSGSIVDFTFLFLQTIRISEENIIVVQTGSNIDSDFFTFSVWDIDTFDSSFNFKSIVIDIVINLGEVDNGVSFITIKNNSDNFIRLGILDCSNVGVFFTWGIGISGSEDVSSRFLTSVLITLIIVVFYFEWLGVAI